MLFCDTGAVNRTEFQVLGTRPPGYLNNDEIESVKNQDHHPADHLSAEALQTEGVARDVQYIVVGVLVPNRTTRNAINLGKARGRLQTIDNFDAADHGASIEPKTTPMHTVVCPVWPNPALHEDENIQTSTPQSYCILGNMEDGLCEAVRVPIGDKNPNLFFYPEWTRDEGESTRSRVSRWVDSVNRRCAELRTQQRGNLGCSYPRERDQRGAADEFLPENGHEH